MGDIACVNNSLDQFRRNSHDRYIQPTRSSPQPLPSPGNRPTIRLRVKGFPHDVNHADASFSVTVTHLVTDAVLPTTLTIHAQLLPSPQWPSPSDHLPLPIQHVDFSGELSSLNHDEVTVIVDVLDANPM